MVLSRGVPVPHAGTSGNDIDYLKPRRVLCDLLSHSLRARDGRLHRRDETKVTLNLFTKDVEWFKRPSSSAITAARAPPAAEPDAASITPRIRAAISGIDVDGLVRRDQSGFHAQPSSSADLALALCARAASGHAAVAPPSSVMNVRRFMFALTRLPRRRGRALSSACRGRALSLSSG